MRSPVGRPDFKSGRGCQRFLGRFDSHSLSSFFVAGLLPEGCVTVALRQKPAPSRQSQRTVYWEIDMDRRVFNRMGLAVWAFAFTGSARSAPGKIHRVAIQVDSDDRKVQGVALGNARNYATYYKSKGEPFEIEIVAFGPGYSMVRADLSMMKGEMSNLQADIGASLRVVACHNTRRALAESEGKAPNDIPLLTGVDETPSGVVRLAELQEDGWAYIRP
jgi:intracellular sulfur oxidation DsrE/DsrF family protein